VVEFSEGGSAPVSLTLHGYWRSTTAYRVRIALAVKGVAYEQVTHDLRTGAQREAGYLALNPQGLVPALETGDAVLTQSPAILEWINETYPDPPLLPVDANGRAIVAAIARHGDGFAFGATVTIADCHLVPQVYSAERFAVDLIPFPHLVAAANEARALPAFAAAHPDRQPDADPA
jgi:maleylpyruvate isomerase